VQAQDELETLVRSFNRMTNSSGITGGKLIGLLATCSKPCRSWNAGARDGNDIGEHTDRRDFRRRD